MMGQNDVGFAACVRQVEGNWDGRSATALPRSKHRPHTDNVVWFVACLLGPIGHM